jgi:hypothetical protein
MSISALPATGGGGSEPVEGVSFEMLFQYKSQAHLIAHLNPARSKSSVYIIWQSVSSRWRCYIRHDILPL